MRNRIRDLARLCGALAAVAVFGAASFILGWAAYG